MRAPQSHDYRFFAISSPLLPTLSLKLLFFRGSEDTSAVTIMECPKKETDSERGTGEGDVSGRGLRAAISACSVSEREHDWRIERGSSALGDIKKACRRKTSNGRGLTLAIVNSPPRRLLRAAH